ncbi:hypothetical protein Tco_0836095 [Tanacetum coccineum]
MEEINNFQQEPDENLYQALERFKELLMKCPQHYLTEMQEVILFYNVLGIPTRQIINSRGAIPSKTAADAKIAIQEKAEYSQKWQNGTSRLRSTETSDGLAKIELRLDAAIQNQGSVIETLEIQIGQMSKVLQGRGFGSLPSSTEMNQRDQVKSISTTIEGDSYPIRRIGYSQYAVSTGQCRTLMYETRQTTIPFLSHLNGYYCEEKKGSYGPQFSKAYSKASQSISQKEKDPGNMPEDIKVPLILGRPFLSTARAKIDVYKRKITLRVEEERIVFTSVKPASSLIKRVYMLSLRERMELDLEARLMGETLVLNRSLDPFFEDYIELNDLNEPFELRRNQGDDLMPTIEEGRVIEEFRTRDDEIDIRIDDYPRDLMNVPIFVGTFSDVMDFAVIENMDAYRDEGMGDIILGEPFLREDGIKTKWFERIITICNGDDEVTHQMVRSLPRFKRHTNEQCNKIPPLLNVSEKDEMNGISHAYQKLKRFYKGILNLGPDYIRDAGTLACMRWNDEEKLEKRPVKCWSLELQGGWFNIILAIKVDTVNLIEANISGKFLIS